MQSPPEDEVEVIPFPLEGAGSLDLARAESWLSAGERERAASFRFAVHRERFIRGRGMVRLLLAERLDEDPAALQFTLGPKGKPSLLGGGTRFNLSHSEGRAVVAISRACEVGVDIESFDRHVDLDGLARRCFLESETAGWERLDLEAKTRAFFWLWTAKEARMKATGEGFSLEPKKIEIACEGGLPRRCLEPSAPVANLAPVLLPGGDTACTVVGLRPFRLRVVATV